MCHRFAGASLSLTKSKTLTVGILNTETDPMGISYVKSENVLYDSPSDDRRDEPLLMVFLCYTYTTFTVLSIPTRPEPFEVRPLLQHLPVFAAVVSNTDPPNSKRRIASHKQCHGLVHMERKCFPDAIVDCILGTAGRRDGFNRCESQIHHLFLEPVYLTSPGRCDAYRRMDRIMEQDHRKGQPPNMLSIPDGFKYLRLFSGRSATVL